jgi:hypothetical protein
VPSNGLHELGNRQRLARRHQQMSRLAQAIKVAVMIADFRSIN